MRLLPFQVGMGNQGAGLTQSKAPLPEQTLALTHLQVDLEALLYPGAQGFPIPQRTGQAHVARSLTQNSIHLQQLGLAQTPGTPRAWPLGQPGQTLGLKAPDPVLYRARGVPQQATHFWTGCPLGHQQNPMEPVVVSRFFRTANLVLQSQDHSLGIGNLKWSHAYMKPQGFRMRNYLRRCV